MKNKYMFLTVIGMSLALTACGTNLENASSSTTTDSSKSTQQQDDNLKDVQELIGDTKVVAKDVKDSVSDMISVTFSSYEEIYNEYSQKLSDEYVVQEKEMKAEVSSGKSIDELADSCATKIEKLAEISADGVQKMADFAVAHPATADDYMEWATKLENEYMQYGTDLETIYMDGAMNSVGVDMDSLGIDMNSYMQDYQNQMTDIMNQMYGQ